MDGAAQAFIAFLRCEAIQSEARAKSLRATAAAIEANNLDGRKKKRKRNALGPKKPPSAYTLFVHENYELAKNSQPADAPSKDVISIVAKQWQNTSEEDKAVWKARAEQVKDQFIDPLEDIAGGLPEPHTMDGYGGNSNKRASSKKALVAAAKPFEV